MRGLAMAGIFRDELPIRQRLARIYAVALDIYLSGDAGPRGCFTVMTAASKTGPIPTPRHGAGRLCRTGQGLRGLFPAAPGRRASYPRAPIPSTLAQLASATIHTIAIRARARTPRGDRRRSSMARSI